jgi:dynein heavy chain
MQLGSVFFPCIRRKSSEKDTAKLHPSLRVTVAAVIVLQIHNRDTTQLLVKHKVVDASDFPWTSQLRYTTAVDTKWVQECMGMTAGADYHKGHFVEVRILDSKLPYLYEYLGNNGRLVITPLTDRCYRTMMSACHLLYGGAPEGPAGTGKRT